MYLLSTPIALGLVACGLAAAQSRPGYAGNWRPLVKDDDLVSKIFQDVDIELLSPAFLNPKGRPAGFTNGTSAATTEAQLDYFLHTLADRNDWLDYITPDFLSEDGRPIRYLYLANDRGNIANKPSNKIRVLIQAHIHGDEPASEEAVLALLGKMDANSTWTQSLLEKLDIMIIPRANPDGVAYFQSLLATNYDPNRDFAIMTSQQIRDLIGLYVSFGPHIFVDCHEVGANWRFGPEGNLVLAVDAEIHSMGGLELHPDIFDLEYNIFVKNMWAALRRNGLRTSPYFTAEMNSTELSGIAPHGHYGLNHNSKHQTIAILIEARGVRLGDQHFQRRVASGLVALTEMLQSALDNASDVYSRIEGARKEFIESTENFAVTAKPRIDNTTWEWIDDKTGDVINVPVTYLNFTPPDANLTRSRPEGYVFSHCWAKVAERLSISGVDVERLKFAFNGTVEALKVETATLSDERYEGVVKNTVTTSTFSRRVTIPAGGFYVSTRQVNAAFALSFLEPENVASAVTYNIIPLNEGDEYPIYRVLKA